MKTVLVTGGAGYVGSHACKALAAAGFVPVAFDNLSRGHREAVRWGPLVQGDILDRPALDAALRQFAPLAVLHFAAFAYVGESVSEPGKYYRNNVTGSLTLLEAMRHAGVHQLVFSSSCATYGVPRAPLMAEDHPQEPINPYGASKLMTERMLRDYDAAYGLRAICLRYFNAAGADPAGETGEEHDPEPHLIPQVLAAAAGHQPAITIFGDQHGTPDGTCVRDYVHVSDLAEAHVLALRALQEGCASTAFNLGNGSGFSVREVVDTARAVTGRPIAMRVGAPRPGDPPSLVADAARARAQLGWQPRIPRLADIIDTAWRWHQRDEGHAGS
ncbi:MAG: UDP-glucose 4-epimerase GalE [Pseudomonadota bacterium]